MQRDFHHHHHFPQKRLSVCLNRTSFIHTYSKLHTNINPYIHSLISIMHITKQTYKKIPWQYNYHTVHCGQEARLN